MKYDRQALRDIRTLQGLKKLEELTENNKDIPVECIIALRDVIYKMEWELKTPQMIQFLQTLLTEDAPGIVRCANPKCRRIFAPTHHNQKYCGEDDCNRMRNTDKKRRQRAKAKFEEVEKWNEHYPIEVKTKEEQNEQHK